LTPGPAAYPALPVLLAPVSFRDTPVVLAGTQPAAAHDRTTLIAPHPGTVVADTADLGFTGTNLKTITVYRWGRPVATAHANPDGTAATALLETTKFPDGPLLLQAIAGPVVRPVLLRVDNAHADHHLAGYHLLFHDEFGGTTLNLANWCTRYQYDGGTESAAEQPKIPAGCLGTDPATGATLGTLDTLGGDGTAPGQEAEVYRDVNNQGIALHTEQHGYLALHAAATRLDQPYLKYESAMIRSRREYHTEYDIDHVRIYQK
jgi:hypothetical protein